MLADMSDSTIDIATTVPDDAVEAAAERVFEVVLGAMSAQSIFLGDRLGWYDALATNGALTADELASATQTDSRYAREWLEQQTVAGFLQVEHPDLAADYRRYQLPAAYAEVLVNRDSLSYMAPFPRFTAALGKSLDHTLDAFRTGGGVPWEVHGADAREAQAAANRPMFLQVLGQEYLASIPRVRAALEAGGRVADIGCGFGWSSIGIALAYPEARVDGFDIDQASIEAARANAEAHGVADRVTFQLTDVGDIADSQAGCYDLVLALECVHDMPDPVSVLASMRSLTSADGTVIVMDERVGEHFTGAPDPVEEIMYGFSLTCCLADGRAHGPSEATGTVMRPPVLESYAQRAGFERIQVLDIDNDFFRFYELVGT